MKGKCQSILSGALLLIAFKLLGLVSSLAQASVITLERDSSTTDAILNGEVTPGMNETVAWFEWGSTANLELTTPPITLPSGYNPVRISALVTNLAPYGNYYYYHAVASNSLGKVVGRSYQFRATPRFVRTQAPQLAWTSIACSSDGARVIASAINSPIYISTNFGVTWNSVSTPSTNWVSVASSANGTKLFAVGSPICASYDSGLTWKQIADSRPWQGLACSADGSTLAAWSDAVFVSHDSGETWQQTSMPSGPWQSVTISADGQRMAANSFSGFWRDPSPLWTSFNSGGSWNLVGSARTRLVSSGDGSTLFGNGDFANPAGISKDWGITWTPIPHTVGCAATTYDGGKWFGRVNFYIFCSGDSFATLGAIDQQVEAVSIACSSDASSAYIIGGGSIFVWREAPARLSMDIEAEGLVASWPSYHLSTRLQENSTLNPIGWTDLTEEPSLTNRIFRQTVQTAKDKEFYRLKTP